MPPQAKRSLCSAASVAFGLAVLLVGGLAAAAPTASANRLMPAQSALALRLLDKLAAKQPDANVVVSPASLAGALSVIERGVAPEQHARLHKLLGFEKSPMAWLDFESLRKATGAVRESGPLTTANAIYFDISLGADPGAVEALAEAAVQVSVDDFSKPETLTKINSWVNARTDGKIPTILDELPKETGLIALNAVYFKDQWQQRFKPEDTRSGPFHLVGGGTVEVPLMHAGGRHFQFRADPRFIAVDLPYASAGYSLVVVTTKTDPAAVKDFSGLRDWLAGAGFEEAPGEVELPRFGATTNIDLMPTLAAMGFKPPSTLPGFAQGKLRLAKAQQRVELRVDEEGTEASAATAVTTLRSLEMSFIKLVADKPFIYALRDAATGLIVVAGYVANPVMSAKEAEAK
jgi:serine protease inhibitor